MTDKYTALNVLKWGFCARTAKTSCIKLSLDILWRAWNVHNKFRTIEIWCIDELRWKREDLVNRVGPLVLSELSQATDPLQLEDDTATQVLRNLVPHLSELSVSLLERIIHAPLTACHYDTALSDVNLKERVCEITFLVKSFLHTIQSMAQKIVSQSAKERTTRLKNAKKTYKKARQLSFHHKPVLDLTRKDLEITESKVREKLHSRVLMANVDENLSFNTSVDSDEHFELITLNDHSSISREYNNSDDESNGRMFVDTSNLLTECDYMIDYQSGISNPGHIDFNEFNSDDSIDDEIRTRLDSNASAEKICVNLEENLTYCQVHVKKLREDLKSFRDIVDTFNNFVDAGIVQVIERIQSATVFDTERELNIASECIDAIRQSNVGKFVHRLRQAVRAYVLKRFMVINLWQWLDEYTYDRVHLISVSPLRMINKFTSVRCSVKQILPMTEITKYLMIVGPIGSGKSFLAKYLLSNWARKSEVINCPFDYDALIPITTSFFASRQTLEDHLAEILSINSSTEMLHEITTTHVSNMRLLFVAELDASSSIKKVKLFIEDIKKMHKSARVIFTCRNELSRSLETLIIDNKEAVTVLQLLCFDEQLLFKFVHYYLENEAFSKEFCYVYEALNLESNLRHPLFVLLSLYLWKKGPTFLTAATCLSKLIMSAMVEFHLRASDYHSQKFHVELEKSHCWADDCVKSLCESIWEDTADTRSLRDELDGLIEITPPSTDHQELFHPFLIFLENHCYLAHPSIRELLAGVYLAGKMCQKPQRNLLLSCCFPLPVDELDLDNRRLSTECMIVASGIWSISDDPQQHTAHKLASLYSPCAVGSPIQWLKFVSETGQSPKICAAVASQLAWKSVWNASNYGLEENVAVSELVRIEAYQPKKVVVGDNCPGIVELLSSLAISPTMTVVLRMERHFYSWNDLEDDDDLVELLQPAGNLMELWAHLNSTGAFALRHMKKMRELNVRVTSVGALITLVNTIPKISGLKSLSLRLNIPNNVSPSLIPRLTDYKGELWIRLYNITDSTSEWALQVVQNLFQKPTEVHLQNSHLTPDILQRFKLSVHAEDGDGSALYNTVAYRIQHGAEDKFVIDAETGAILVARGAILDPDRTQPRTTAYPLEVIALDGGIGEAQKKARTLVNITIIDVNNKPPMFVDPGTVSVRESVTPGNFIAKIEAFDPDDDHKLRFALDGNNSEARNEEGAIVKPSEYDFTTAFEIGEEDGVIRLARALDREKVETLRLLVICEDLHTKQGPKSTSTTLTVIVEDINDNDPKFRKPFYRRSVAENSEAGLTIVTVVADDVDKNRTITYSLQGRPNVTSLVHLDSETGEMVVRGRIDREQHDWLNFTVLATDSGVPERTQIAEVFIQVLDENDNNPEFVRPPTRLLVREDAPPGSVILTLEAMDADAGDYARVTFLLDPKSAQGMFKIDPDTGEVSVAQALNRELSSRYSLIAEAWDNYKFGAASGESRSAFTQIDVEIADINDEPPRLEPRAGCVLITEYHEPGAAVTVVRATDGDDPNTPNGRMNFSLLEGNEEGLFDLLQIDPHSAELVSTAALVGRYGNYTLTVAAQDQGEPSLETQGPLTICVTDYNDHPPRFVFPDSNMTIMVPENATVGSLVIQVQAVDDDIGANGAVRYRMHKDVLETHRTFTVDGVTGGVTLLLPLDRELQKIYELRVEAYDQGLPTALSNDLDLTIYVKNVNDCKPQFPQDIFAVNFTENKAPLMEVVKIVDTADHDDLDLEDGQASPVCYFIVGGDTLDTFHLDRTSHELAVAKSLDREEKDVHTLLVRATEDCLSVPVNVTEFDPEDDTLLKVVVYVNDVNDNRPKFVRETFTGGISTESDFGLEVMRLVALDPDSGLNAALQYSLKGRVQATLSSEGLDSLRRSPFLVDPDTGAIRLNFDPQRGMKGYFDFEVFVNDTGGGSDRARVFIYLLREDQRVLFVLRQSPEEIRNRIDYLRDYLSNVTGAIVNVDDYRVHENHDGTVDQTKTDLYLHLVDPKDNSVLEVPQVLSSIDKNVHRLDHLFKELNVLDTSRAQLVGMAGLAGPGEDGQLLLVWLVGVVAFLALLLVVTLSLCVAQRAHYARQLKAATATAFGSNESGLNRVQTVPNTNLHSVEGSNPIWLSGGFDNEWYKEEESLRYQQFVQQTEGHDSLDENAVDTSISPRTDRDAPYIRHSGAPTTGSRDTSSTVASSARLTSHEQRTPTTAAGDQNYDTYRNNLHHTFRKLANPLIDKKLETTEL